MGGCPNLTLCYWQEPARLPPPRISPPLAGWRTARITQLEGELLSAHATIQQQEQTIEALRAKTDELATALQTASEDIMSHVDTGAVLKQAAHAAALEQHPEWKGIIGVGYTEPQRRDLIYKHLQKLLDMAHTETPPRRSSSST